MATGPADRPVALVTTRTGAWIEALIPQPDDDEPSEDPCVWCGGEGVAGGGADEEELYYRPELMQIACGACRGTGKGDTHTTRGEQRRRDYEDRWFWIDATRAEKMDRDVCPDCGYGGCSEDCWRRDSQWVMRVADARTGEEAVLWADEAFVFDSTWRTDEPEERLTLDIAEWVVALDKVMDMLRVRAMMAYQQEEIIGV